MDRTDEQIKVDVVRQLDWNASVDASDVKVAVDDGIVDLSGSVNYYSDKKSAENSAELIPGVKDIDNRLVVRYPVSVKIPTDPEIRKNVDNTILWDSSVFSVDIDVEVEKGEVTLEGSVDAFWKKMHAERIVSEILGVTNVINKLAVVPTDTFSDKALADNIVDAIDRLKMVDAQTIDVKVNKGTVTLTGTAPSWITKRAIERAAGYTSGVVDVKSRLAIN